MSARHRTPTRTLMIAVALAAVVALGAACRPVARLGEGPLADPVGVLDVASGGRGEIRIAGWAASGPVGPNRLPSGPTRIVVLMDGQWVPGVFQADRRRDDVDAAIIAVGEFSRRQPGNAYGFDFTVDAGPGRHDLCVTALNADYGNFGGDNVVLGCRTVTVR